MIIQATAVSMCLYIVNCLYDRERRQLKRNWNETMQGAGLKNRLEQSFEILKIIQTRYGWDMIISLPKGKSYEELEKQLPEIETGLSAVVEMQWKRFDSCAYLKVAVEDYDSNTKFALVKTEGPWQLYFGDTFFKEHLIADMKEMPHVIVGGATASGKSRCVFIGITNLLYWHDDIGIYLAQASDKKDLQKFAHYKQTQYFAKNLQTIDQMVKHLLENMKERNEKLGTLNNIYEYNALYPDSPFTTEYLVIDEGARLMPGEKAVDPDYMVKRRITDNVIRISQEGRSAGIYIIECLQRPDKVNLDPNIKANFNIKIGFRANNTASSKVMADDESLHNLPNREAIFMGSEYKVLKTPYIDDKMIQGMLAGKYEESHKYIDLFPSRQKKEEVHELKETELKHKSKGVLLKC